MKLSIITINRNNAEGLRKTIESVLRQTFTDMEYIIVDGASTDDSVDVLRSFIPTETKNIFWCSEPDTGIYNAMNKGIKMANGEYLLFLNSGDFLIKNDVLERVFAYDCVADILCARCAVSDNGKVVWTSNPPEKVTFGALYQGGGLAHQSTFIRHELFEKYGLYREDFRYNSDIAFWYKSIIDNRSTTQRIDVITTDYNLDGISSRQNQTNEYLQEMEIILNPYCMYIPDYDAFNEEKQQMKIFYWLRRHKWMNIVITKIYNLAGHLNH